MKKLFLLACSMPLLVKQRFSNDFALLLLKKLLKVCRGNGLSG